MDNQNVAFHVSVLTVPNFVTPEKFPSWLHQEAAAIQEFSVKNGLTIIKLFLASRIKKAMPRKKLDMLLQNITDKYPNIFRVEMVVVETPLNIDEIKIIESDAESELAELMKSVEQYQQQKDAKSRLH